ncbi:hypothetical protein FIBSPDRAFT_862178 [Athelia psychrophila]|uniref:Uncharacterized protein n=1 Tax=Athelia psychrophila TaxID=1759441 RepID=A0A166ILI9_9AGAM|nr:hypothetical protein FIBSPDRAFT_862178 [Fibularhizoctonia sp. CBS 109695]
MVRVVAGYTIEQDELVRFIAAQPDWGPVPGDPQLSVDDAWMIFIRWRKAQPQHDADPRNLFPRPQYWYDKDERHVHAFMTRHSKDVDNPRLRFREMPIDKEIRDRFIEKTGGVLDPAKMRFWSFPETSLYVPLAGR